MSPAYSGLPRTNGPVCGRKCCHRCGRWRLLLDFYARKRNADGEAIAWQTLCATCQRVVGRYRAGMRRRGRPYQQRRPRRTVEQRRARERELHRLRREDARWLALHREYDRIYHEVQRRQRGVPPRPLRNRRAVAEIERVFLPRDPLVEVLKLWAGGLAELERVSGVPARSIYRVLHESRGLVTVDVADKIAVALGVPLATIYPEDR
jgi:hypothetical protein